MLDISNLTVSVGEGSQRRRVLNDFSLQIGDGQVHVLFGPNGSGKTTLVHALLGYPGYTVEQGSITLNGKELAGLPINERVAAGLGVVLQYPPAVRGITLNDMANLVQKRKGSSDVSPDTAALARKLNVEKFLQRDVNHGFSGGEKKRAEVLQVMLQDPSFLLLDEPDSGVDVENVEIIGRMLNTFLQRTDIPVKRKKSALIITHLGYLLKFIDCDRAHVICEGQYLCGGNAKEIYQHILDHGFDKCANACLLEVREGGVPAP